MQRFNKLLQPIQDEIELAVLDLDEDNIPGPLSSLSDLNVTILMVATTGPAHDRLRDAFAKSGAAVIPAPSRWEAATSLKENIIDLVIWDIDQPQMSGWEVGKNLKDFLEENSGAHPPLILLTGSSNQAMEEAKLSEFRVHAVIEKPVAMGKLLEAVREAVEQNRLSRRKQPDS